MFNERKEKWFLKEALSINALHVRLCLCLQPAAQVFQGTHIVVNGSDCHYLPYSIHVSEFM